MLSNCKLSRDSILDSAPRIPFDSRDLDSLCAHLRIAREKGLDLALCLGSGESLEDEAEEGFLVFKSATMEARFMVVKVHGSIIFPGRSKPQVFTFYADSSADEWIPLVVHGWLGPALTVIANMYGCAGKPEGEAVPRGHWVGGVPA